MRTILSLIICVALVLHSLVLFLPTEAVSPARDNFRSIPSYYDPSDPCIRINDSSKRENKEAANKVCGQAFLLLVQNNANTCRGWRHPECRLLPGFSSWQCSCLISVCDQSGIINDETRSFRECSLNPWTDRYFSGQLAPPPPGPRNRLNRAETSARAARVQSSHSSLNAGGSSSGSTPNVPIIPSSVAVPARAAAHYEAGSSRKSRRGAGGKTFTCDICQNVYQSARAMTNHRRMHTENLTCQLCKTRYGSKSNLGRHIRRRHKGEEAEASRKDFDLNQEPTEAEPLPKPFVCGDCGAAYAWEKSLKGHLKSHEAHLTTCPHCNRVYSNPANLLTHIRNKHADDSSKRL